mmetsp:Transcript_43825/g.90459  ORF Transcript_43825/g.90459 Transcript_43825/m.90459 type:complete len:241 (+) Transcript_43825:54-776(+)
MSYRGFPHQQLRQIRGRSTGLDTEMMSAKAGLQEGGGGGGGGGLRGQPLEGGTTCLGSTMTSLGNGPACDRSLGGLGAALPAPGAGVGGKGPWFCIHCSASKACMNSSASRISCRCSWRMASKSLALRASSRDLRRKATRRRKSSTSSSTPSCEYAPQAKILGVYKRLSMRISLSEEAAKMEGSRFGSFEGGAAGLSSSAESRPMLPWSSRKAVSTSCQSFVSGSAVSAAMACNKEPNLN